MGETAAYIEGVALVLGGSGGLGAACAERIAKDGNPVVITYRHNARAAQQVAKKVGDTCVACYQLDVNEAESCGQLVQDVIDAHGKINALVYAIGSNIAQPLVGDIEPEHWSQVVNNDLNGFVSLVQPIIHHMRENGGGALVHISSAGLARTPPRDSLSVAPKAAIDALIKTIAIEEGCHGIRANSVGVGVIEAGIFKRLEAQGVFDDNWKTAVKAGLPLGRFGQAQDIAEAANFLASNRARYITGQTLFVDGGYSA